MDTLATPDEKHDRDRRRPVRRRWLVFGATLVLAGVVLGAALGITVYWPIVCLAALVDARDATGWNVASETPYWIVCVAIASWGASALWALARSGRAESQP